MCRLNASHCCLVVNKDYRLSPSTSLSSSWFLSLAYIALVVGIHHTRCLVRLSLAYIAPAVCIHRTHLLLILSVYQMDGYIIGHRTRLVFAADPNTYVNTIVLVVLGYPNFLTQLPGREDASGQRIHVPCSEDGHLRDSYRASCHKTSWRVINPKSLSRVYIRFITGL